MVHGLEVHVERLDVRSEQGVREYLLEIAYLVAAILRAHLRVQ